MFYVFFLVLFSTCLSPSSPASLVPRKLGVRIVYYILVPLCQSLNHHNHLLLNLFFHPALLPPTPTEALAGSTVKIAGRDVLATWKLLVGLAFIPALYATYTLIALFIAFRSDWPSSIKLLAPLLTWNLLPFISYASMRFGENGIDVYRSLRPLFLSIFDPASVENLRTVRDRLSHDITDLINEYGPKVFPDFDADRILLAPSHTPRATTPTPSASAAMKLAGGFFTTKMDWLDDRIFNWGRADDSETDDIFFFMDKQNGGVSGRASSRGNSGSDPEEERGARFGTGTSRSRSRSRTSSFGTGLSSETGFKVEAMTELPRNRSFNEVANRVSAQRRDSMKNEDDGYAGDREDGQRSKKDD
ncbi:hypothetical protein BC936DRAFT_141844 [Jimgerdemannia flammicorona]|uniref:Uncharacterized protein n=1 Tax=Jimgerdemannia flammicorona TaxID=994334 RepID=A0A433A1J7_9FUNG|nr:hypothetical protein BC936DRAFT_141844 [Jimgerdemannia flammicorona]